MMLSDGEDGDDEPLKKQSKIRPKPSGPLSMVLRAHAAINNKKQTILHKTCTCWADPKLI